MATKKEKLPTKMCSFCGNDTSDYTIVDNAIKCKDCQKEKK
jgi:hypothetical protein